MILPRRNRLVSRNAQPTNTESAKNRKSEKVNND